MKLIITLLGGGIIGLLVGSMGYRVNNPWYWVYMLPCVLLWVFLIEWLWEKIR